MTPADIAALVPSAGIWGIALVVVARLVRWAVERSDGLTQDAIERLARDLERCRARRSKQDDYIDLIEDRWYRHRKGCPLLADPSE